MFSNTFRVAAIMAALPLALTAQRRQGDGVDSFEPVATFGVPGGLAEIVTATEDGKALLYTNSSDRVVGFVDLRDPRRPQHITDIAVPGEPTSVDVLGEIAVAAVWVDLKAVGQPPPSFAPGALVVMNVRDPRNPTVLGSVPIGWHPDSVKLVEIRGRLVAIVAIENEPCVVENGVVTDDDAPGNPNDISPAGFVQVITLNLRNLAASNIADVRFRPAALQAAGLDYPADAQPEFVTVNRGEVAVSLQENNGIAVLDIRDPSNPSVVRVFSTGVVADRRADLTEDDDIRFTETYPADVDGVSHPIPTDGGGNPAVPGTRNPDAIAYHPDGEVIYTADEGELNFTGGRGVSAFLATGRLAWSSEAMLERLAVGFGYYPEGRSENKGVEFEGVATARYGRTDFAFFLSERGSFVAVFDVSRPMAPRFVQLLPTGISPEGVVAIPQRNLLVTAEEVSGTLSIFRGVRGPYRPDADQPALFSKDSPWSALSGMAPSPVGPFLFAVPDNALPTKIYAVRTGGSFAPVTPVIDVKLNGQQARYDGEGLARDTSILRSSFFGGFWIASEGNGRSTPNLLVQVDLGGNVVREIQLPNSIDAGADPSIPGTAVGPAGGMRIRSNGFEGCCVSEDGRYLYAAIQRDFVNEFPTGDRFARIARYDLRQLRGPNPPCNGIRCGGDWEFFYLRLDSNDPDNWAGLSEIITLSESEFLVIERDNQIGVASQLKKIYRISIAGLASDVDGVPDASDTVVKTEVLDVLDEFFPFEKIEGLAIDFRGDLWVGLDNDGGELESRLINFGRVLGRRR
ncbi:MAG: esterase-like activity of phytase family protein [Planctomycetota bacterium]